MDNLNSFRFMRAVNPPDYLPETGWEYICVDPNGIPFSIINQFSKYLISENFRRKTTAKKYIQFVNTFFNYLYNNQQVDNYLNPVNELRETINGFIQDRLGWQVERHRNGNLNIRRQIPPKFIECDKSISRNSLKVCLSALKNFYDFLCLKGYYQNENPFTFHINNVDTIFKPGIPPISGVTRRDNRVKQTYLYYCLSKNQWRPQFFDNPRLKSLLIPRFTELNDRIITRILFTSGARIDEVLDLKKKDWLSLYGIQNGAWARNKGDGDERVKIISWDPETDRMLKNYVNHEREKCDKKHNSWNDVEDEEPIFLNKWGNQKTYWNYYPVFKNVCKRLDLKLTPHQIRHWLVTMAIQVFNQATSETERIALREDFIAKMKWNNHDTINIYDNHVYSINVDVFQIIANGVKELDKQLQNKPEIIEIPYDDIHESINLLEELELLIDG